MTKIRFWIISLLVLVVAVMFSFVEHNTRTSDMHQDLALESTPQTNANRKRKESSVGSHKKLSSELRRENNSELERLFAESPDPAYARSFFEQTKIDPSFEWKQPINFWGEVVDEAGNPVEGANIHFRWNDLSADGASTAETTTDAQGLFSLKDRRGKRLYVSVGKKGFYAPAASHLSAFEYANPYGGLFRPDQFKPVVFYLRKMAQAEPLVCGENLFGSRIDGTVSYVDLVQGKIRSTPPGDLTVQITRSGRNTEKKFDWTFALRVPDGGLIESTNEFMFLAPEDGYVREFVISHKATDRDWSAQEKHKFFIKSRDGLHYGRVEITIIPGYNQNAAYDLNWCLNTNRSRNLEFDEKIQPKPDHYE